MNLLQVNLIRDCLLKYRDASGHAGRPLGSVALVHKIDRTAAHEIDLEPEGVRRFLNGQSTPRKNRLEALCKFLVTENYVTQPEFDALASN